MIPLATMTVSLSLVLFFGHAPELSTASEASRLTSDPTAVFGLVDRLETHEEGQRVDLHGCFSIGKGKRGGIYQSAREGVLSLRAGTAEGEAEAHERFFRELGDAAGSGKVVAFGTRRDGVRYQALPDFDATGVAQLKGRMHLYTMENDSWGPVLILRTLPRERRASFPPGRSWHDARWLELSTGAGLDRHESLRYVFQVEHPDGTREVSQPIAVGEDGRASWGLWVLVPEGAELGWSVHAQRAEMDATAVLRESVSPPAKGAEDRR